MTKPRSLAVTWGLTETIAWQHPGIWERLAQTLRHAKNHKITVAEYDQAVRDLRLIDDHEMALAAEIVRLREDLAAVPDGEEY